MRIGSGIDIHRLEFGRPLIIGGIKIESSKGEVAHSDGDVLIHALIDALLGATAQGDIGKLFPPTEDKWKNINSIKLLQLTLQKIHYKKIINLDCNIILQEPKLSPYIDKIRSNLSILLSMDISNISIKAKTAEHILQEFGSGDAIFAEVTLLLEE